jgi:hypothetical protein
MWCWRRLDKISWTDRVTNEALGTIGPHKPHHCIKVCIPSEGTHNICTIPVVPNGLELQTQLRLLSTENIFLPPHCAVGTDHKRQLLTKCRCNLMTLWNSCFVVRLWTKVHHDIGANYVVGTFSLTRFPTSRQHKTEVVFIKVRAITRCSHKYDSNVRHFKVKDFPRRTHIREICTRSVDKFIWWTYFITCESGVFEIGRRALSTISM